MPKFFIPEHVMRQYRQDEAVRMSDNRAARQAMLEHFSQIAAKARQKQEKQERQKLQERISERATEDKTAKAEIALLKDEGYQYSLSLARRQTQDRIDCLTLDQEHYKAEIAKFKEKEWNSGFLVDELEKIETDLNELNVNHEHDIN